MMLPILYHDKYLMHFCFCCLYHF